MLSILLLFLNTETQAGVVITTSDQQTIESLILDVASLSWEGNFKDGNLVINYSDGTNRQIAISNVESISFTEDAPTDISQIKAKDTTVKVFDFQGRLILQDAKASTLETLPKGHYLVKNKDITIKYRKK